MVSVLFLIFSVFGMILSSKRKNPAIVREFCEFFENSSLSAGAHFFSGKKQEGRNGPNVVSRKSGGIHQ